MAEVMPMVAIRGEDEAELLLRGRSSCSMGEPALEDWSEIRRLGRREVDEYHWRGSLLAISSAVAVAVADSDGDGVLAALRAEVAARDWTCSKKAGSSGELASIAGGAAATPSTAAGGGSSTVVQKTPVSAGDSTAWSESGDRAVQNWRGSAACSSLSEMVVALVCCSIVALQGTCCVSKRRATCNSLSLTQDASRTELRRDSGRGA